VDGPEIHPDREEVGSMLKDCDAKPTPSFPGGRRAVEGGGGGQRGQGDEGRKKRDQRSGAWKEDEEFQRGRSSERLAVTVVEGERGTLSLSTAFSSWFKTLKTQGPSRDKLTVGGGGSVKEEKQR
jgi:hypothetical protein